MPEKRDVPVYDNPELQALHKSADDVGKAVSDAKEDAIGRLGLFEKAKAAAGKGEGPSKVFRHVTEVMDEKLGSLEEQVQNFFKEDAVPLSDGDRENLRILRASIQEARDEFDKNFSEENIKKYLEKEDKALAEKQLVRFEVFIQHIDNSQEGEQTE